MLLLFHIYSIVHKIILLIFVEVLISIEIEEMFDVELLIEEKLLD